MVPIITIIVATVFMMLLIVWLVAVLLVLLETDPILSVVVLSQVKRGLKM